MRNSVLILLVLSALGAAHAEDRVPAHPHVRVETTEGIFVLELDGRRAPLTVRNFLYLTDNGFFDGTIFHRVIPDFMIQGGGYTPGLKDKEPDNTIPNESGNGLSNVNGTIAMARLQEPHTASAQFYINIADNTQLDPNQGSWGYTVFGYVIEGMEVVDKIALLPTGPAGNFKQDVPVVPVVIKKVSRVVYDD